MFRGRTTESYIHIIYYTTFIVNRQRINLFKLLGFLKYLNKSKTPPKSVLHTSEAFYLWADTLVCPYPSFIINFLLYNVARYTLRVTQPYTSITTGTTIGLRCVFWYKNSPNLSLISFLKKLASKVRPSVWRVKCLRTSALAACTKSSFSRI